MTDMEDRCRRNNVRLVGLPEGMEGPDAAVFFSELIFQVDSFLEGPWHWDWSGASRVWWREGLRSAAHSHLPCTEMAWQIRYPERCSAGVSGEVRTEQCHTAVFFLTLVRLQRSGERHLVRFWRRWQHLVSSPSSSYPAWLSYGTKENREASIPLRKRRILSVPFSAEVLLPPLFGGTTGEQRPLFLSGSTGGAWGLDGLGPSCPEGDDSRMAMDAC